MATAIDGRLRRKRGSLSKRTILDASAAMFHEKGYDRTTLDDIAGLLSVTKPSLYYYFQNKEDILIECVRTAYDYFEEEIARRDDAAGTGRQRVETFLRLYLEVITHDIGVSMVLADDRVMSDAARETYHDYRRRLHRALEERIAAGVSDGTIVTDDARLTSVAIFGMFYWVGNWNFRRSRTPLDDVFDRFTKLLFDGIGGPR